MSAIPAAAPDRALARAGIVSWLVTTDHKRIGILYMTTTFAFFAIAGILALLIRVQLAHPGGTLLGAHAYDEVFTLHGTAMIFLFVAPFALGLANYVVPLQIGAPDMAFPRTNALSYWFFLAGGLSVFAGVLVQGGAASAGWTGYAPLSEIKIGTGDGIDLWAIGLALASASSILTALNLLTTVFVYRAPGMTMWRIPIFTWEMVATSLLILMAFPPLAALLALLLIDRRFGGHAFDPGGGGSPILYQHLFWFFGHPEVYVMILPYFGVITEIVATFSRKRVFGYFGLVLSAFAIAGLSMGVWAHHMFTTGAVADPFFAFASFLIAVPTGVKFFNWIGTMWKGQIVYATPMLFALGFMLNFLLGGITGVMVASPPIDFHAQDSYFVVAHFHYTLGGGSLFAIFAAVYYWWPKITGTMLDDRIGRWVAGLMFVGFNTTFLPMHYLGAQGMPRRVYTYPAHAGLETGNLVATIGAFVMAAAVVLFAIDVLAALRRRRAAGPNPWDAQTLEWWTSSPPPERNFHDLPPVRSPQPTWDATHPAPAE